MSTMGSRILCCDMVQRALGDDLNGKQIAALGLAFKPDVDDLRESPAVEIVHLLRRCRSPGDRF